MMLAQIPIFITARAYDDKMFNLNKESLKFSYLFIKEQGLFDQTYVISDNPNMITYAEDLGFKHTIYHECHSKKDILFLEYLATHQFSIKNNYYPDWIIILNINQLFKTNSLLFDCINKIDNKYDIVASYTEITDKSKFFLENGEIKNKRNLTHILSSETKREKMIDAAIYAVKTTFAYECMEYDDPSEHFWKHGKIKYFKNDSPYTDIHEVNDIYKFRYVCKRLNEVKNTYGCNVHSSRILE